VAICLAGQAAWGHTFPPVRTVVVQVEDCQIALLVGYRPAGGEATQTLLGRIAAQPKARQLDAAKAMMTQLALGQLTVAVDGKPLIPTSVRAKLGVDPDGTRPNVVVLVTFTVPAQGALSITSKDADATRISWSDKSHGRVDLAAAPAQGQWHVGVASMLLSLSAPRGVPACATSQSSTH
jgi:hypothetical protein